LYAMLGTVISTFVVGGLSFTAARAGLIRDIDQENPMEALMFGALISAVDPVATLAILGNAELRCNPLLYSLVFGESVLNDAVAIALFKVFAKYYDPEGPHWSEAEIPSALWTFVTVSCGSILVGVVLGLSASYLYKHTRLHRYPSLETSLLFCFCYLCYSMGEVLGGSGIMALFFEGMILSHYNSYNLSPTAHVAAEHLCTTLSTLCETAVFVYMGMGVFTGRFYQYDWVFSLLALLFCIVGRLCNIFPLSCLANCCRSRPSQHISLPMQCVMWFSGVRGAIAFALAMNMPGAHQPVYATATLFLCMVTTLVCGGCTHGVLLACGMSDTTSSSSSRQYRIHNTSDHDDTDDQGEDDDGLVLNRLTYDPRHFHQGSRPRNRWWQRQAQEEEDPPRMRWTRRASLHVAQGVKRWWTQLDDEILKPNFGGDTESHRRPIEIADDDLGNYEMGNNHLNGSNGDDYDDENNDANIAAEEDKFIS
jgi:solute carrier family 9 (sodium/hydrogen exchanger), member 8